MDTRKRRIVYFNDQEWEELRKRAAEAGTTISAYLRSRGWAKAVGTPGHAVQQKSDNPVTPTHHMTQTERDAVLRRINRL